MCIKNEEIKQERRKALEILEKLKKQEKETNLKMIRINPKTVKYISDYEKKRHKKNFTNFKVLAKKDLELFGFEDFSIFEEDNFFDLY